MDLHRQLIWTSGDHAVDQHLCFCYIDSTNPLLPKSEISSLYPSSVVVQQVLCQIWSETLMTAFVVMLLM